VCSYLRIEPRYGCIEVGHLAFAPRLQRTRAASEAMYLMMRAAFALGYRRYEWKCNALNAASRAAALRLGFSYEGTFRQRPAHDICCLGLASVGGFEFRCGSGGARTAQFATRWRPRTHTSIRKLLLGI
jgi:RimJ/RimL family protein N-acetyltransferase